MSFDKGFFMTGLSLCFSRAKRYFASGLCTIAMLVTAAPLIFAESTQLSKITFSDLANTPCYYNNKFFVKDKVEAKYSFGNIPSESATKFGHYFIEPVGIGSFMLTVDCDGTSYNNEVIVNDPGNFVIPAIMLSNVPPVVVSFEAKLGGDNVVQAPPNSTITLTAVAEDADGDPLSFTWGVNGGAIITSSGSEAQWQLPVSGGLHFAYVLVTDGKGGYVERGVTVSTDGSAIFGSQAVPAAGASDGIPQDDHFLGYKSINTKMESCEYYRSIHAVDECGVDGGLINPSNFTKWRERWGLNDPSVGVRAIYANKADLNLQRNMHGISNAEGTAYYVCNYPRVDDLDEGANLDNAIHNLNLAACVGMENSSDGNGGEKFTKFYVFSPSGDLLQSVNLDGRGEKYIPGSCVVCHGGSGSSLSFPNLGSSFLPFDLDNFVFSSHPGLSKLEQQSSLRQLNEWIRDNTNPKPAIGELINGWYSVPGIAFNSDFTPKNWEFDESDVPLSNDVKQLYRDVVKPYCRTCHVAMNNPFSNFVDFRDSASSIDKYVCGNGEIDRIYSMPNARVTFDLFWGSPTAIHKLSEFMKVNNPNNPLGVCNPPQKVN